MSLDVLTRSLGRIRRPPPLLLDGLIATGFLVLVAAELVVQPVRGDGIAALAVLTLAMALGLLLRRRMPLAGLAIAATALSVLSFLHLGTVFSPLATLIGAYSVGLYASRVRARWGLAVVVAGVVAYFASTPGLTRTDPVQFTYILLVWVGGWAFGYTSARRREDQDRARSALERQVVAEERVRMSRELHDVVGHTVNLLMVQAGAARLVLDRDPAQARTLLRNLEDTGRATLADLDRVLASLRADPGPPTAGPAFGLAELPGLVERFAASGIDVRLAVDPGLRLPRDLDLAAYRIVQEALTNTLKHAAPCSATVTVARDDQTVRVEVSDTGPGSRHPRRQGRGLVGIAERVSLCGGVLEHGNDRRGGFRLRAVLPLP